MKVLLLQDVYNLGLAGEVKTVADGYGRNYLLPRRLAVLATPTAVKRAERIKQAAIEKRAREKADVEALAQVLSKMTLTFNVRVGEKGKLYGSITSAQIADAIATNLGTPFDKRKVMLREPIREVGTYTVPVRLSAEAAPAVTVVVQQEGIADAATNPSAPTEPATPEVTPEAEKAEPAG
ncbi:MAG: 50S ribosomal protein L9 [Chloroflexi bacterium]|uniref:Large ribosomal subunit protein bL9 n=1 Tax=Candidatus Thermofonsia Clade 3 bacterium TaxID=2364212 RepID=A0A2M8QCC1_9CHLR|nr:50S ribosomal protein L9 [Candidatus Roseilinea sp. NK_OTU-006]PJF47449.1 MAG: 50S ribosomal protein L9 [Candidatus Thermofonsia Clade 3 bacterium]RMG65332.1 MAG: 50S ribosomal protein L9 [Chloroflexota bacterium]